MSAPELIPLVTFAVILLLGHFMFGDIAESVTIETGNILAETVERASHVGLALWITLAVGLFLLAALQREQRRT
ncbi:MAG: hypothetical protein AAGD14_16530 [Planctomycetota bacterium]